MGFGGGGTGRTIYYTLFTIKYCSRCTVRTYNTSHPADFSTPYVTTNLNPPRRGR